MKTIAMYLPQFHATPENDKWWGEGFTEWTTVRAAESLYEGHNQPRIPTKLGYYNLLDKETIKSQLNLMNRYGVDGICMYHYWFQDGKRVLEKPEQNLLKWKDINLSFCFCWANETWARSWSNVKEGNSWCCKNEKEKSSSEDNGILMFQDYGDREMWKEHFFYLLPYFKDKRYICVDEKPVFVIYKMSILTCADEMLSLWRDLAKENGLKGLYIIGANCNRNMCGVLDGQLYHEPQKSVRDYLQINNCLESPIRMPAQELWDNLLDYENEYDIQPYFEGFVGYDDTPRRGRRGIVIEDNSPEIFKDNFVKLLKKNENCGSNITFINAWNEWGEGMYLEPDVTNEFKYLEAILEAKKTYKNINYTFNSKKNEIRRKREVFIKRESLNLDILNKWLYLLEDGVSITDYILNKYGQSLSIYGYGVIGKHLYKELSQEGDYVHYVVEQKKNSVRIETPVYGPDEELPEVGCMIITAVYYYDEIKNKMKLKGINKIISIDTIINDLTCLVTLHATNDC